MMLTVDKVPSPFLTFKEEEEKVMDSDKNDARSSNFGLNFDAMCCLPGSKLPLYSFKSYEDQSLKNDTTAFSNSGTPISFLSNLIMAHWEDRLLRGLFHYDVTTCETKVIKGKYGFIAQLNEGRHLKKRPTEFRVDQVLQTFDQNKFNFTKVGQEEVLFRFEQSKDNKTDFFPSFPYDADSSSPSVIAINVSPIEYGHVLLLPRVLDRFPQRIDRYSFLLALQFAKEVADPFFRVGYNSLGAFATINHLHFQAYYMSLPFPVEKSQTQHILTSRGVKVSQLLDYPVRGLIFEQSKTMGDLCDAVSSACILLQNNNIPFNVLITDCGKKVFLFPQCYAHKQTAGEVSQELLDTQVNPAVWEISGHIVLKRREDYDNASEDYVHWLLTVVSVMEERFEFIKSLVLEVAGLLDEGEVGLKLEEDLGGSGATLIDSQDCMVSAVKY